MKVAIYGQAHRTESLHYIVNLIGLLTLKKCEVSVVKSVYKLIKNELNQEYTTLAKQFLLKKTPIL